MEGNLLNFNSSYNYHKKIKIKKKLLEFPSYISDEELKYRKKKINKNLMTIENNHNYFLHSNLFNNNKDQYPSDYITDLNNINNSQSLRTSKKLNNKRLFSAMINSKKSKNIIKDKPLFLKDSINPYKKYNRNKTDINNDNNDKLLSKKQKKKNLTNANFSDANENKNKNENIFLTSYKKNYNEVNKNSSPKFFLDKNSKSNLTLNESNNYFHKYNSNITFYKYNSETIHTKNKTLDNFNINYRNNSNNNIVNDFKEINITDSKEYDNSKKYKIESKIITPRVNDTEGFKIEKLKPSSPILILSEGNEPNNNKSKNFFSERNLSYKTTKNSKRYFISSNNHIFNRNNNELNNIYKNYKGMLPSEKSMDKIRKQNKKKLLNEIADINEELKTIQNGLINQQEDDSYFKLEELIKKSQNDNIVTNILIEKGRIKFESTKELFKKMKQKNFLSELKMQYFRCKKGNESSYKKRFLKELKKMDLIEKKEALLRDLAYKKNYDIRRGVNRLKEKDLSKEREIFNRKTDKIGKMNINNIKNFIKNMNKFK